jgi:hypothetical protein
MVPFCQLGVGKAFGELALQVTTSKDKELPRAATVRCLTNCIFATMHKAEY